MAVSPVNQAQDQRKGHRQIVNAVDVALIPSEDSLLAPMTLDFHNAADQLGRTKPRVLLAGHARKHDLTDGRDLKGRTAHLVCQELVRNLSQVVHRASLLISHDAVPVAARHVLAVQAALKADNPVLHLKQVHHKVVRLKVVRLKVASRAEELPRKQRPRAHRVRHHKRTMVVGVVAEEARAMAAEETAAEKKTGNQPLLNRS